MCGYNKVNGVYASEHHWLLTEVLRDEWGWDGVVVSDWGAVHDRVAALRAGLDWEMPPDLERSPAAVEEAIRSGELDRGRARHERAPDAAADRPWQRRCTRPTTSPTLDAHHALARRAAAASIVLLKNDGNLLPLAGRGLGGGDRRVRTNAALPGRRQFAGQPDAGRRRCSTSSPTLLGEQRVTFGAGYGSRTRRTTTPLLGEAVALAADADVVVCVLGLPASYESEGYDRTHIELPPTRRRLLDAVIDANANVVVVLVNGSVVRIVRLGRQRAGDRRVLARRPGRGRGDRRCADRTSPSRAGGSPRRSRFGSRTSRRRSTSRATRSTFATARDSSSATAPTTGSAQEVTFPFGHGLSYTTFELSELAVDQPAASTTATSRRRSR